MKLLHAFFLSLFLAFSSLAVLAEPVDINTADAATLAKVMHGIGLKRAQAIVAYRKKHGAFKTIGDLRNVKGVGEKTIERNRNTIAAGEGAH